MGLVSAASPVWCDVGYSAVCTYVVLFCACIDGCGACVLVALHLTGVLVSMCLPNLGRGVLRFVLQPIRKKSSTSSEDNLCMICCNRKNDVTIISCDHRTCECCIRRHRLAEDTCCFCKRPIERYNANAIIRSTVYLPSMTFLSSRIVDPLPVCKLHCAVHCLIPCVRVVYDTINHDANMSARALHRDLQTSSLH